MKKIFYYQFVFVSFFLLLFSACTKTNNTTDNQPESTEQIVPLAVGNNWQYTIEQVLFNCVNGVLYCEHYDVIDTTTAVVSSIINIDYENENFDAFVIDDASFSSHPFVYRNTDQGFIEYGKLSSNGEVDFAIKLKIKFPIQAGETWKDVDEYYGNEYLCVSTDEIMTTNVGSFHCYVFELVDDTALEGNYTHYYYAPEVGLIAEIRHKEQYFNADAPVPVPEEFQDWYVKKLNSFTLF